jgi:hypothetical protein
LRIELDNGSRVIALPGTEQTIRGFSGAGLLIIGFRVGARKATAPSGRLLRWRERAVGDDAPLGGLMILALTAAIIEAGSMLPYIAAIGLIGTADLSWPLTLAVMIGYCAVMVLPAIVLLAGRVGAAKFVEPVLVRINDWMERTGRENTAWLVGIVGFILAVNALDSLGILGLIPGGSDSAN